MDYEQEYWNQVQTDNTNQGDNASALGGGALNHIDWPVISTTTNRFTRKKTTNGHGPEKTGQELNGHWPEKINSGSNSSSTAVPPRSTSSSMPRILNTSSGHWPEKTKKTRLNWVPVGCRDIDFLSRDDDKHINSLEASQGCWERIAIKIDSGAVDTVMPPDTARFFPVKETEASKSGRGFRAANGTHIANHGERHIKGLGDQWQALNLKAQVADVKTALGSVFQMLKAGNKVHFEKDNCYIEK